MELWQSGACEKSERWSWALKLLDNMTEAAERTAEKTYGI